jgi:carbon-monoxide dehydrogenase medium subunit
MPLPETARAIGDVQVRNRGTIGGSLTHADPSADWPAAILALGGELKLSGPNGERRIAAEEFFLGTMATAIEPTEILTEIHVPVLVRRCGSAYLKMAQQAPGSPSSAWPWPPAQNGRCDDIGVGMTGLSEKPFRAHKSKGLRGNKLTRLIEEALQRREGSDPPRTHASANSAHLAQLTPPDHSGSPKPGRARNGIPQAGARLGINVTSI